MADTSHLPGLNGSPTDDDDVWFLDDMAEKIANDPLVLKIFLRDELAIKPAKGFSFSQWLKRNAKTNFPRKLRVAGACITNCDLIWFNKHFYW